MNKNERLKILRKYLNLTTRAFGKSIGLSGSVISNIENGRRNMTKRTLKDICREYNVNPQWLINGIEPMFFNIFEGMELCDEVEDLTKLYSKLSDNDKTLIKRLIHSLSEKIQVLNTDN